jgi:eukaryotic-like serine/threonine-protein kinase
MMLTQEKPFQADELDSFIARFESAHARSPIVNLSEFLPDSDHPIYGEVLRELTRIDLEYTWTAGRPKRLEDYARQFPDFFQNLENIRVVAFEEYRLRLQHGDQVTADEYQRRFDIDTCNWPTPPRRVNSSTVRTRKSGDAVCPSFHSAPSSHRVECVDHSLSTSPTTAPELPQVGDCFLGFRLLAELGCGAFGRVYLAEQGDLAQRPVALKVSNEFRGESQTLAQLQHTNIVPIYSEHSQGSLHAICMPFFGSTTLADVLGRWKDEGTLPLSGKALADTVSDRHRTTMRDSTAGKLPPRCLADLPTSNRSRTGAAAAPKPSQSIAALATIARLSYVEAILWIGARLADGLAHAHERGILHRDLKPANILLADDGQPMLLDFNLSHDLNSQSSTAMEGGTLPYMAPEHLAALGHRGGAGDPRSDLYALGVILYEMLAGAQPFPVRQGGLELVIAEMIDDRRTAPAALRPQNSAVTPAVQAIIFRCLEPDPAERYQSAAELRDDLERHLQSLPLRHTHEPAWSERAKKWIRRHPRLTSATSVFALATVLLVALASALVVRTERLATLDAAALYERFHDDLQAAQFLCLDAAANGQDQSTAIAASCRAALDRFHVLDNPGWQRASAVQRLSPVSKRQVTLEAGELLFLMAAMTGPPSDSGLTAGATEKRLREALDLNEQAQACYPAGEEQFALRYQHNVFSARLNARPASYGLPTSNSASQSTRDGCMVACLYSIEHRFREALTYWQKASSRDPHNLWAWYGLGCCYEQLSQPAHAVACYTACIALKPDFGDWYFHRGVAYLKQRDYSLASLDFDRAIQLQPGRRELRINRALARLGENRSHDAIADLLEAIAMGGDNARVYFILAQERDKIGDVVGAKRDRDAALTCQPADDLAWVSHGVALLPTDPIAAMKSFDEALKYNAHCLPALESKAHVLSEKLERTEEAVETLDRAVALYPEQASAHASRGVLLARLGKYEAARADAERALSLDSSDAIEYQVSGIYALSSQETSADRNRAIALLTSALRHGYGSELIAGDADLNVLRNDPNFQKVLLAAQTLQTRALEESK